MWDGEQRAISFFRNIKMLHCINETFKHATLSFTLSHCNAFE